MLFNEAQRILPACVKSPIHAILCVRDGIEKSGERNRGKKEKGAKKMDLVFTYRMMFGALHSKRRLCENQVWSF